MKKILANGSCDILLIHPSYHRRLGSGTAPPIGLGYLASSLRKEGFTLKIIDCALFFDSLDTLTIKEMKNWLQKKLILINPKLAIGIGPCTTSSIRSILAVVDTCRDVHPCTPLIFGRPLTLIPDQEWLFFERLNAFAIIKGDGEYVFNHVLTELQEGELSSNIPGVQTSENQQIKPHFIRDLDILPYPAWDMFEIHAYRPSIRRDLFVYPFASMVGSRGCPHHCGFCISGQFIKYRRHSFEYIAKQIEILRKNYLIRSMVFYDDSMFPDASKVNEEIKLFADLVSQSTSDVLWQIEIRPDVFSAIPDDTFEYLFSCGCRQMNIGIEKISFPQLELLSKPFDVEQLREKCLSVARNSPKMRLTGTFILGGPRETPESIHETIQFSTQFNLLFAHYYPLELYPGTPIYYTIFGQENRIWFDRVMNNKWPWGEIVYESDDISTDQLMKLVYSAYNYFYERSKWRKMAKRHLGSNYRRIQAIIKSWQKDRFRICRGGGI
jgi:anaerobic magnesium-protoporphyrin IX monomethyl ester cyclase